MLLTGLLLSAIPMPAHAQGFNPPDRGMPARREGGGTRGCWGADPNNISRSSLTALAPQQNFSYTIEGYPSFFVYVPESLAKDAVAAEFMLQDTEENVIYTATYQVSGDRHGIFRVDLPRTASLSPLTVGQDYNWSFTLICNPSDPSANLVVDSWIQRIQPTAELQSQLASTPINEIPNFLASQGLWYDTLTQLANLAPRSDRSTLLTRWQTLLDEVELDTVVEELTTDDLAPIGPAAVTAGVQG